jgi:hypothetical protein
MCALMASADGVKPAGLGGGGLGGAVAARTGWAVMSMAALKRAARRENGHQGKAPGRGLPAKGGTLARL